QVPSGAVIFVSCPPRTPNAIYGGLMSTRAQALGAVGSVIDGRFRDLQEQRELAYPVKSYHRCHEQDPIPLTGETRSSRGTWEQHRLPKYSRSPLSTYRLNYKRRSKTWRSDPGTTWWPTSTA